MTGVGTAEGDSAAFPAQNNRTGAGEIGRCIITPVHIGGIYPDTVLFQLIHCMCHIGHPGNGNMFHSSGRGLGDSGGQADRAPFRNDHSVCAGTICRTDQGAQIMRILNAVKQQQQRGLASDFSSMKYFFH